MELLVLTNVNGFCYCYKAIELFREGVVRAKRGLSTVPIVFTIWQILKNETHAYIFRLYLSDGLCMHGSFFIPYKAGGKRKIWISLLQTQILFW